MTQEVPVGVIEINLGTLPSEPVPSNEESAKLYPSPKTQSELAPKSKSIQGDASGSSTPSFANVTVVKTAPK